MELDIFGDTRVFALGPIPVTVTMITSSAVSAAIVGIAWFAQTCVADRSSVLGQCARMSVRWLDQLVSEIIGRPDTGVVALSGSLFLFIAACNLSGQLPGVHPPTGSLATTSALAVIVFFAVPFAGIRARGIWGYLKHYFSPNPLLFPLHLISEFSRTLALAMRLFGNIMSGHLIVGLMVALSGFLVPMPFMALDLLIGLLQAYIFAVLSTVFIGAAIGAEEQT